MLLIVQPDKEKRLMHVVTGIEIISDILPFPSKNAELAFERGLIQNMIFALPEFPFVSQLILSWGFLPGLD